MKTRDAFIAEDEFDPDEALVAAVKKRKFLLERMLEDRQHFPRCDNSNIVIRILPRILEDCLSIIIISAIC